MFGYILPEKAELKLREYTIFRSYYCGLCLSLKNRYGRFGSLLLNYDSTFLGLLLSSLNSEPENAATKHCLFNPLVKHRMIINNSFLDYAADVNLLLAYHNIVDNWNDDKSFQAGSGMLLLKKAYGKAASRQEEKNALIKKGLAKIAALEKAKCPDFKQPAEAFGQILSGIFPSHLEVSPQGRVLSWLGFILGQWVYLVDACDDLEKDVQKKSYNPLLLAFSYKGEPIDQFKAKIRPVLQPVLIDLLAELSKSFELLNLYKHKGIIENIVYVGMLTKTEQVLGILGQRSCEAGGGQLRNFRCQKRGF
ncbi:DUF5685 family protein [Bacillota bacterium LX-D]|nr:DUF5685 family protein [Bacillota bacterium LX-D]